MQAMATAAGRQLMKKYLLRLVIAVVALDSVVIGLYYALRIGERPERTQQTFVAVWVVVTLLIVATLMKKIRQARRGQI
jgi:heme/copper-type cytochrome/quinol oxidase subunit 4